jgi:hypothetical protein
LNRARVASFYVNMITGNKTTAEPIRPIRISSATTRDQVLRE